jgi:hypothetical protein
MNQIEEISEMTDRLIVEVSKGEMGEKYSATSSIRLIGELFIWSS